MLTDSFFEDIEMRIYYEYNIKSHRYIQNQMKEFYENYRGLTIAYDEGITKDDAVLAAAFWRNLFQNTPTSVDFEKLAKVVNYFWKNMKLLDMSGQEAFQKGEFGFLSPDRTPAGMEWQPHFEDLAQMQHNINIREQQWATDKIADLEAVGWDFSKPLKRSESELPTVEDQAWDKERRMLGFQNFPAIPPPQDAEEVLAEEFEKSAINPTPIQEQAGKKTM
jgi:Ubiquinol-cytochrome C chaperone